MTYSRNILIWSSQSKNGYSGGRYHACILAKALSLAGYRVYFMTTNIPLFYKEIIGTEKLEGIIPIIYSKDKDLVRDSLPKVCSFSFVVPGGILDFDDIIKKSLSLNASLVLLNFESGNWFNQYSPLKRNLSLWDSWKKIGESASIILSSNKESQKYAKKFYKVSSSCSFESCYPAINSHILKEVPKQKKEKRILIFLSVAPDTSHKGGAFLHVFMQEAMAGYTLTIVTGKGKFPDFFREQIKSKALLYDINLEWHKSISDYTKYKLLKKSTLLLFPSLFEGFGYPPVEALNCSCSVIAFDLPVLREVCGDRVLYAKHGNIKDFKEKIGLFLEEKREKSFSFPEIQEKTSLPFMANSLKLILDKYKEKNPQNRIFYKEKVSLNLSFFKRFSQETIRLFKPKGVSNFVIYPAFEEKKEALQMVEKINFLIPFLKKESFKISFKVEKKVEKNYFRKYSKNAVYRENLSQADMVFLWKEASLFKKVNLGEEKVIDLNDKGFLRRFSEEFFSKKWIEKNISENRVKFLKASESLLNKGKRVALFFPKKEILSLHGSSNLARVCNETYFQGLEAYEDICPDIVFVENLSKLILEAENIQRIKHKILNFLTSKEDSYLIAEFFDGLPLLFLFPEFKDQIILIPQSPHTSTWNLEHSYLLPEIELEDGAKIKSILSTLFIEAKIFENRKIS